MYFSGEWASKISRNFFDCLTDNGMLVVSSCELSVNLFPQFRPDNYPGAVLYRKINAVDKKNNTAFLITSELLVQNKDLEKNHRSPDTLIKDSAHLPIVILEKTTKPQMLVSSSEDSANVKQNQIRTLINESKLDRALDECNDAIESEKLSANLYFLRASIYKELKKYNEATVSLKQAIYIKPEYIMGHFALGNLYEIQGNATKARRSFKNALELLNELPNDALVEEFEGMPAIHIRTIILANLQTQKVF
jgi:chemotaxis protein methyltransferase CheR